MKPWRLGLHPISVHELTYPFDIVNIVTLIMLARTFEFSTSAIDPNILWITHTHTYDPKKWTASLIEDWEVKNH